MKTKYRKRPLEAHNQDRMNNLSLLFREYRYWTGMSRQEIEDEYGISRSLIERIESSKHFNYTLKSLLELADVYQIPINELFDTLE